MPSDNLLSYGHCRVALSYALLVLILMPFWLVLLSLVTDVSVFAWASSAVLSVTILGFFWKPLFTL